MDIKYAILGFLSWKPYTGYDLKKVMTGSLVFYWSGNNNQIYTTLVQMHKNGLVTIEVQPQERFPARKVYSITEKGKIELEKWVASSPELPQLRKSFLVQLAWANSLKQEELETLIDQYENEVKMQSLMIEENERRQTGPNPTRSKREAYIWKMIARNYLRSYQTELDWIQELRRGLKENMS